MLIWAIDDNPLHETLLKTILCKKGFQYRGFRSCEELKAYLQEDNLPNPHLVLIDLHLGQGCRGEDIMSLLKEKFKDNDLKYIAFTADIAKKDELYQIGFDGIIYKPVTKEKLITILGDFISGYSQSKRKA
ncbi:MAG: response regulator [Desulfonauticus sp.]|nr:response regulator [Desulfonauticus sp.]